MIPAIKVVHADALATRGDVLVIKYAQESYGLDKQVTGRLRATGSSEASLRPAPGDARLIDSRRAVLAQDVLVVGTPAIYDFDYRHVRDFPRRALRALQNQAGPFTTVLMTVHGVGFGLDERECFDLVVAGIGDAIDQDAYPSSLREIFIVEEDYGRAQRFASILGSLFPGEVGAAFRPRAELDGSPGERRATSGDSDSKRSIFVAMPFDKSKDDHFYYAISPAARKANLLATRIDNEVYTGSVIANIRKRIEGAEMLVAEVSASNPNVYLEIGFAWGVGIPTVFIAESADQLRFDIRGENAIVYSSIRDLEDQLTSFITKVLGD